MEGSFSSSCLACSSFYVQLPTVVCDGAAAKLGEQLQVAGHCAGGACGGRLASWRAVADGRVHRTQLSI